MRKKDISLPKASKVKDMSKRFFDKVKELITKNPVLISGLSLGPIVAISQSLKAGVSLSVAFAIIIVPVMFILTFIKPKISKSIRVILSCLLSCVFFVPAFWFAQTIFPEVNDKVGVFLPLMVVNPIISASSAQTVRVKDSVKNLIYAVKTSLCFTIVMCTVSFIREIFGSGSIWGKPLGEFKGNISFLLPFMGFILVGFLCAGANYMKSKSESKNKKEAE